MSEKGLFEILGNGNIYDHRFSIGFIREMIENAKIKVEKMKFLEMDHLVPDSMRSMASVSLKYDHILAHKEGSNFRILKFKTQSFMFEYKKDCDDVGDEALIISEEKVSIPPVTLLK